MNPYKKGLGLVAAMIFAGAASKPKFPEMPPPPKPRPLTFESEINPPTEAVAPARPSGVAKEPWQNLGKLEKGDIIEFKPEGPGYEIVGAKGRRVELRDLQGRSQTISADTPVIRIAGSWREAQDLAIERYLPPEKPPRPLGAEAPKPPLAPAEAVAPGMAIPEVPTKVIPLGVGKGKVPKGMPEPLYMDWGIPIYFDEKSAKGWFKVMPRIRWDGDPEPFIVSKMGYGEVSRFPTLQGAIFDAQARVAGRAIPKPPVAEAQAQASMEAQAGTGCIPCGKAHLNRVAGLLEEAMRFARREGLGHPEVVRRVDMAERELANMEAVDLTPENMAKLPPEQKEIAEWALTKGREIRHFLDEMNAQSPVSELERTAVRASEIATEYRARTWGISPEVMKRLLAKAQEVKEGRLTKEAALEELRMEVR